MNAVHITRQTADDLLNACVKERGEDYVYPDKWRDPSFMIGGDCAGGGCRYRVPGTDNDPACIIGLFLTKAGKSVADVTEGMSAGMVLSNLGFRFTETTEQMLNCVQQLQDQGFAWGEAVEKAHALYPE